MFISVSNKSSPSQKAKPTSKPRIWDRANFETMSWEGKETQDDMQHYFILSCHSYLLPHFVQSSYVCQLLATVRFQRYSLHLEKHPESDRR